jgi:predicted dienelactone hydrolase
MVDMRLFEWLLFLSFAPVVLLPLPPQRWRRAWLLVAAPLPALAGALHLAAEGWRAQMVPLYILAALVLAGQLPALLKRAGAAGRGRGLLASAATALMLIPGGLLAGWLLPVVALPQPSGPYAVGIVDRELVDQARGRRLMVSVWYPAAQRGAPAPLTHHPDEVMAGLANLTGLPAPLFQHLRYISLAASEGAPALASGGPFPALVFSHGFVGLRLQSSSTLQELASWGYVVVALDHTDAAAVTVFPDGQARFYNLERFGIPAGVEPDERQISERVFPVWVADQRFVYDTLEAWERHDPLLAGRLDLGRIGSVGHSFGGATALEVCRIEPRCRAAVDMDGGLYGGSVTQPAVRPLLLMTSADSGRLPGAVRRWTDLIANARGAAYWLELPNSSHLSFTFSELLSPLLAPQGFDPRAGLRVVDKYLRAFFDTHLRGAPAPRLGPGAGDTDVYWRGG